MPSLHTIVHGRGDLPGPLSQLALGRDGTFYVVAAGRCNHAGKGHWEGETSGNGRFIGIEAENTGKANDPWPMVQMDAYRRGVAAVLRQLGRPVRFCAGHGEYALPAGRKADPSFDMPSFRASVTDILAGNAPPPPLIPSFTPAAAPGDPVRPTLRRGATGPFVKEVQIKVGAEVDGFFGHKTEALVRAFQRDQGLVPDGIVGPKTWASF